MADTKPNLSEAALECNIIYYDEIVNSADQAIQHAQQQQQYYFDLLKELNAHTSQN